MDALQRPPVRSPRGLRDRVRRAAALIRADVSGKSGSVPARQGDTAQVDELRERLERLEAMVENLQDALYRHSVHEDERIDDLRHRTEPEEIARSLSHDARRRGL
jgi:vacuolar-type H+-ATPase subunit I/STV1